MPVFMLSYRLGDDQGAASRRYSLMRALHKVQRRFWDRTEHAVVFETSHTLAFLGDVFKAEIDPARDLFLLCQIGSGAALLCGANSDPDILSILPDCRTLG